MATDMLDAEPAKEPKRYYTKHSPTPLASTPGWSSEPIWSF
jgi:hypothetical protein